MLSMVWLTVCAQLAGAGGVSLVAAGAPSAVIVVPEESTPISAYAAEELAYHIEKASGVKLELLREPLKEPLKKPAVYLGATQAARDAGIKPESLASEVVVLRTVEGNLYVVGHDGPGNALDYGNTYSGTLWGVYEILERYMGVRWLWPGELGEYVPKARDIVVPVLDETVVPRFNLRNQRPGLGLRGFTQGNERMGFSTENRERYGHDQTVFLRRHRMGRSADSYYAQPTFGGGHSFTGWWGKYGKEHPDWFQLLPNGKRGPENPDNPDKVSMCVSNSALHAEIIRLWQEERARHPGQRVNIDISESDGNAYCVCDACRAWDDPMPSQSTLPAGLERSYEPVQAGARYARFAKAVYDLASVIDPNVIVNYYAYLNYFWAPNPTIALNPGINIQFVPWFRWAGWFPRTEAEHEWIKKQWLGWEATGASLQYRPNWFLDGYTMPLVYMHQFGDAFQFYVKHSMVGTDFDSLQGQWAAQGPNLYLLSRIHVRPQTPVDDLLGEYYAAFGPASDDVKAYFTYWEDYAIKNSPRSADAIRSRWRKVSRRYAHYARVADLLYPQDSFVPAEAILKRAADAVQSSEDPIYAKRVEFLQQGLAHAKQCAAAAAVVNDSNTTLAEKRAAIADLVALRRSLEHTDIANMDRAAIIETDSWKEIEGLFEP